jgi:hypothetical protein
MNIYNRIFVLCILLSTNVAFSETGSPGATALDVFKSPSCGCCGKWVEHIEENSFTATVQHPSNLNETKAALGIPPNLSSCHTGVSAEGYFFEGHVPASVMARFLANPPADSAGLAVPGMPAGSPGMEMGSQFTPYNVVLVKKDGSSEVFARMMSYDDQF